MSASFFRLLAVCAVILAALSGMIAADSQSGKKSVWVLKGKPVITFDKPADPNYTFFLHDDSYTCTWRVGTETSTNTLTWSLPPQSLEEGAEFTLTMEGTKNPGYANIYGSWILSMRSKEKYAVKGVKAGVLNPHSSMDKEHANLLEQTFIVTPLKKKSRQISVNGFTVQHSFEVLWTYELKE
jgi:hypothetical protein